MRFRTFRNSFQLLTSDDRFVHREKQWQQQPEAVTAVEISKEKREGEQHTSPDELDIPR